MWRWVSACKYIYTYMYVLVLTYISVHMGIIFLLHIMYYLWMIYICLMQLLFNFGNKLIFIVIVIVNLPSQRLKALKHHSRASCPGPTRNCAQPVGFMSHRTLRLSSRSREQGCRGACQISERSYKSLGCETLRNLTMRRLI